LKQAIDDDADVVVLDVRTPKEYEAAHIPDAINAPRGLLEFAIWSLVPDQQETIYVYCKTGARAALATKLLNDLGYKKALAVDTGGLAWVKAGYPVQTSISDETLILQPGSD
jgi:rhodanese-related sulfurtransferase